MTRDEVLAALSRAEVDYVKVKVGSKAVVDYSDAKWKAKALRAAAELIRAGGWRPIAEAPGGKFLVVAVYEPNNRWYRYFGIEKGDAIANGYTHYLPEPEPPALEVPNERG
jgi:hypothetical protein